MEEGILIQPDKDYCSLSKQKFKTLQNIVKKKLKLVFVNFVMKHFVTIVSHSFTFQKLKKNTSNRK
jgi:hypothetical protein